MGEAQGAKNLERMGVDDLIRKTCQVLVRCCRTPSFTLRGRCSSAWASVVTSVGKTHCSLPKAHPDACQQPMAVSPGSSWSRVPDAEGVTSPDLLHTGQQSE